MSHSHHNTLDFLDHLEKTRQPQVPVMDADTARTAAMMLEGGYISARRMARALDASFDTINATFAQHGIDQSIDL